jgi:hypothetical protein
VTAFVEFEVLWVTSSIDVADDTVAQSAEHISGAACLSGA